MDSSANARLEILYRQCYPSLYRYALWALRDHHQAAAEEMGLSLWACQKRLQRIRKKLRAQRLGCTLLAAVLISALIALPAAGQKCLLPAGLTWQQVTDSAQIQSQLLDATLGADGLLTLSYSVSAWGTMHALGAERIVIWRQVDETSWVEALRYDETTAALWTPDGQHHSGQVRYQGWPATAYRVEVTLFAENDQGRDSRTWSKELRP